jgi:hypothetical protein
LRLDYPFTNRRKKGCKSELFFEKKKNIFSGGEAVVDLWEDELLGDDFSDEEEELEDLPEDDALELPEDGFADWEDASDGAPEDDARWSWKASWSRTSIPETIPPSWRTRRKKPRPPARSGSSGKFAQRLCGGWRKQPGRNRIF